MVQVRFAATGDFRCGKILAQGNLVIRDDVLLVNSHAIYKARTYEPLAKDLRSCFFTAEVGGKKEKLFVKEIINSGYKCPNNQVKLGEKDWAVLRLKDHVSDRIKPYRVNVQNTVKGEND